MSEDVFNGSALARWISSVVPLVWVFSGVAFCGGEPGTALLSAAAAAGLMWVSYRLSGGSLNPALHDEDELDRLTREIGGSREGARLRMTICIIRLGLLMAATGGRISEAKIEGIRTFFRDRGADAEFQGWVDYNLVNATRHFDMERICAEVNSHADAAEKEMLLQVILYVALFDDDFDQAEIEMFFQIAVALQFSPEETARLLRGFLGIHADDPPEDDLASAWAALGLEPDADFPVVRKAYLALVRQYHPDRVSHLGPEFVALAHERMQSINTAYERLEAHLRPR